MHGLQQPQLPHPQGNPGHGSVGTEKILPEGTQTHGTQGVPEEVGVGGWWWLVLGGWWPFAINKTRNKLHPFPSNGMAGVFANHEPLTTSEGV
jgi:hypothetical protein